MTPGGISSEGSVAHHHPGPRDGIGTWTDEQIKRAITQGIRADAPSGRPWASTTAPNIGVTADQPVAGGAVDLTA
jgi:hypothetical protein